MSCLPRKILFRLIGYQRKKLPDEREGERDRKSTPHEPTGDGKPLKSERTRVVT